MWQVDPGIAKADACVSGSQHHLSTCSEIVWLIHDLLEICRDHLHCLADHISLIGLAPW